MSACSHTILYILTRITRPCEELLHLERLRQLLFTSLCMRDEHRPSVGVSCAGTLVITRCHRCTFSCKVLSPPARVDATRVTHFGWLCPVMSG